MKLFRDFKSFAVRGQMVDLAAGVIIGAAFAKIIDSILNDLMLPIVGKIVGNVDFSNLYIPLSNAIPPGTPLLEAKKLGPVFAYGNFLSVSLNFFILAFCVFLVVKGASAMRKKEDALKDRKEVLLEEIRDLLKKNQA